MQKELKPKGPYRILLDIGFTGCAKDNIKRYIDEFIPNAIRVGYELKDTAPFIRTVGAKMSDVPGHTKGMIPILKRNGVRFLHLGINPATPVPPLFHRKCGKDESRVMYEKDYGEVADFENFKVYFAHTGDNRGVS